MFYLACKQCTCMPDESGCGSPLYTLARVSRKKKRTLRCASSICRVDVASLCVPPAPTLETQSGRAKAFTLCVFPSGFTDRPSYVSLRNEPPLMQESTPNWNTRCDDQIRGRCGFSSLTSRSGRRGRKILSENGYPFLERPRNICRARVKALLTWPAPNPMSICIIIRQWAPCFMHEGKNAWTICPRPTWPRVNLCAMLPRPARSSHSVSKLHREKERERGREDERVSIPARRNNSRDRPRSRKRKGREGLKKNNPRFQVLPFTGSDLHANLPRTGIRGSTCTIISPRVRVVPPLEIPNGEKLPFWGTGKGKRLDYIAGRDLDTF